MPRENKISSISLRAIIIFFAVVCFLIALLGIRIYLSEKAKPVFEKDEKDFLLINKNVKIKTPRGNIISRDLPCVITAKGSRSSVDSSGVVGGVSYTISFVPEVHPNRDQLYINVNSAYTKYTISHEDKEIYSFDVSDKSIIRSGGLNFKLIRIPELLLGKKIDIEFTPSVSNAPTINLYPIVVGSKDRIVDYYYTVEMDLFIYSGLLFLFAIVLLVSSLVLAVFKFPFKNVLLISMLYYFAAQNIIMDSWTVFYVYNNRFGLYFGLYFAYLLMPVPFLLLANEDLTSSGITDWRSRTTRVFAGIMIVNFIFQSVLTLTGIREYNDMEYVTDSIFTAALFVFMAAIFSIDYKKHKDLVPLALTSIPTLLFLTLGMLLYKMKIIGDPAEFIVVSMGFFGAAKIVHLMILYVKHYRYSVKRELYSELALLDNLSGLSSRYAYEKELNNIKDDLLSHDNTLIAIIDLNNLKLINDDYGHSVGDEIISGVGKIVLEECGKLENANAYRIGGDEFVIIVKNSEPSALEIIGNIKKKADDLKIQVMGQGSCLAVGYKTLKLSEIDNINDFELDDFISEIDAKMFGDKALSR